MIIHAFVEGFWPAIVIPMLLTLLVIVGVVPPEMAVAAAGIDATLEIATGMMGTARRYYWGGQPTLWMYVGAVVSTVEVIPLGFLIAYTMVLWRRGEYMTEFQKTFIAFITAAAFGGAIGVVAFGAGLMNMPVINYASTARKAPWPTPTLPCRWPTEYPPCLCGPWRFSPQAPSLNAISAV